MVESAYHKAKPPRALYSPHIHKFGGSSLKNKGCLISVLDVIKARCHSGDYIVVSANGKVTNLLFAVVNHNACEQWSSVFNEVKKYITELVTEVLDNPQKLLKIITDDLKKIEKLCQQDTVNINDIVAYGELWSAQLLHHFLKQSDVDSQWIDARKIFTIDQNGHHIDRQYAISQLGIHGDHKSGLNIFTGYIASNCEGGTATFGRNGSDYSATLLAKLLKAPCVNFWTDVDGVYSADPNLVASAKKIDELSFCEAQALSELGSNVLHQKTMSPIIDQSVNISINCGPSHSTGTSISRHSDVKQQVKTIASKKNLVGLCIDGISELETHKLQAVLKKAQIYSYANRYDKTTLVFHFYVEHEDSFNAIKLSQDCDHEVYQRHKNVALISVVGQDIRQNHKIITTILSRSSVFDVVEIFYPANSHTLSLVITEEQSSQLLNDLHQTFFELEAPVPIVVLGYGNIGQQFLKILGQNKTSIENKINRPLALAAVANSRYFVLEQDQKKCLLSSFHENGLDLSQGHDNQGNAIVDALKIYQGHDVIIVDLTASEQVALLYEQFAKNHWHIISANKFAAAERFLADNIETQQKTYQGKWLKNTTVGAGLPVQTTIDKLQESGDVIRKLSGIFSGSLSWLFGQFDGSVPFSALLREAQSQAFTEPDPREDLSGQDVFRKVRIMARALGFVDAQEEFEPAIPHRFLQGDLSDFWNKIDDLDAHYGLLYNNALISSGVLRYVAELTPQKLTIKLQVFDKDSPYAHLNPCDNIFIIHSEYYDKNPLILRGPGAGKEVTAAGVLNDLIEVLKG